MGFLGLLLWLLKWQELGFGSFLLVVEDVQPGQDSLHAHQCRGSPYNLNTRP